MAVTDTGAKHCFCTFLILQFVGSLTVLSLIVGVSINKVRDRNTNGSAPVLY